jgi:hypothetical protein
MKHPPILDQMTLGNIGVKWKPIIVSNGMVEVTKKGQQ